MGRNNNYATDEPSTIRAVEWLRNGAKSRGMEIEFLIGHTLGGTIISGEIKGGRLSVVTAAVLGDLAESWEKEISSGAKLNKDELSMAAICAAAYSALVGIAKGVLDLDDDTSADNFIRACREIKDEEADE